eukprot:2329370-Pyramimonas_sp.AAC.1
MAVLKALASPAEKLSETEKGILESFWATRAAAAKSALDLAEVVLHCKVEPIKKKEGGADKVKISFATKTTHADLEA